MGCCCVAAKGALRGLAPALRSSVAGRAERVRAHSLCPCCCWLCFAPPSTGSRCAAGPVTLSPCPLKLPARCPARPARYRPAWPHAACRPLPTRPLTRRRARRAQTATFEGAVRPSCSPRPPSACATSRPSLSSTLSPRWARWTFPCPLLLAPPAPPPPLLPPAATTRPPWWRRLLPWRRGRGRSRLQAALEGLPPFPKPRPWTCSMHAPPHRPAPRTSPQPRRPPQRCPSQQPWQQLRQRRRAPRWWRQCPEAAPRNAGARTPQAPRTHAPTAASPCPAPLLSLPQLLRRPSPCATPPTAGSPGIQAPPRARRPRSHPLPTRPPLLYARPRRPAPRPFSWRERCVTGRLRRQCCGPPGLRAPLRA